MANATPVYGYAELTISNTKAAGFSTADQATSSVTLSDASTYPGDASANHAGGGAGTQRTNIAQATSGPGPFPSENTFSQRCYLPMLRPRPAPAPTPRSPVICPSPFSVRIKDNSIGTSAGTTASPDAST